MIPEANKQETTVIPKQQIQDLTDLTSFNAFAFVTLSDGQSVGVQLTGRHGIPADRMYGDFKAFVDFLDMCAKDSFVKFVDKRAGVEANPKPQAQDKPADNSAPAATTNSNGSKRDWKKPLPANEVPEELSDLNVDVYAAEFDYFVVSPKPEGKSTVEFFKDGLEFAIGAKMNNWKHETIAEALKNFKEINPKEAEKYRVAGIQYFVLGNEYVISQGARKGEKSHYKNLKLLKPIF